MTNPYLKTDRLPKLISIIQAMGAYRNYKLSVNDWREVLSRNDEGDPKNADVVADQTNLGPFANLDKLLKEHPEFFRDSPSEPDSFSLVYRRFLTKVNGSRPPLAPDQLKMLLDIAISLHTKACEAKEDRRWLAKLLVPALAALCGAALGAYGAITAAQLRGTIEQESGSTHNALSEDSHLDGAATARKSPQGHKNAPGVHL